MGESVIMCDEVIEARKTVPTETIPTTTISTNTIQIIKKKIVDL